MTHGAARIAWVSFHSADGTPSAAASAAGFTRAPDVAYTDLLRNVGFEVTRILTSGTPDVNLLNTFDLVIVSRSNPSGNFQTEAQNNLWHSITKPTMHLGGYALRGSRLGFSYGESIPDTTEPVRLTVTDPTHAIFRGVTFDENNTMVNPFAARVTYNNVLQLGISVNNSDPVAGMTVLGTVPLGGADGIVIGEVPAGTEMGNAFFTITAGKRLVFLTGSRESGITSEGAGIFDLETDGVRLFLNAVAYLTGQEAVEPPPLVTGITPAIGTTRHYAPLGLSFRVTSSAAGGVPTGNISLTLNGVNVTSNLTVTGTATERQVSFAGLVANTNYTGVIMVRDAAGKEVNVNINFDTLPPFGLPTAFSFPVNTAVQNSSGMRMRMAQGYDFVTPINTADRAEAQLAGTMLDPDTNEPYPNGATPSSDNPDGSYNITLVNHSIEAGGGVERGNFSDPQFPDQPFPGLGHNLNFSAEVMTYLELAPGRHVMGVNSDDGFVVYTGTHHKDLLAVSLGRFDGGRGAADTTFQFDVTEAGLYPFRVLYYQGGGEASLEWFTVDPFTGEKILVNDRANAKAVRAWRQTSAQERPYIESIAPRPGERNLPVNTNLTIVLRDAGAQVQQGSIQLTANGQALPAQVTQANGATTIRFVPPQALASDTVYNMSLGYTDTASRQRTVTFDFGTQYVPPVQQGVNIVWVSFHPSDEEPSAGAANPPAAFTAAPDIEYTRLLRQAGHTVTRYITTGTPDVDFLNTFDMVMVSRSNPSGNFQSAASTELWHSITKPTIHLGGYAIRANRLGFVTGDTIPDVSSTSVRLRVNNANHPIFAGVALDANGLMVNEYAHRVTHPTAGLQAGISVNNNPVPAGATVLAVVGTPGDAALNGVVISEFPAGTRMANAAQDVTAAKRLVFLTGSREAGISSEASGVYDLGNDGAKMFLNAVRYMAGLAAPEPVTISASRATNGDLQISWPESGTSGAQLQATTTLAPANWQPVAGTPTVANGRRTLTVPTTGNTRFFRLMQP